MHINGAAMFTCDLEKKTIGNGSSEDSSNALRLDLDDVQTIATDLSLRNQLYASPSPCSL